jgi:D-alanyl-D-alanine dipeptidase
MRSPTENQFYNMNQYGIVKMTKQLATMQKKTPKSAPVSHRILGYEDLARIAPGKSSEPLVDVQTYGSSIIARYNKTDMYRYTGDIILVRDTVARKLAAINTLLKNELNMQLKIVYGYRHPDIQEQYFKKRKNELGQERPELDTEELDRLTHNFVAIPDVAGHPTGGAVDVTLVDAQGYELDMGTAIADYTDADKIQTFHQNVTAEQASNRKILHDFMLTEGFAPFYGEWWHFSYGDREWAAFYDEATALYNTVR